MKLNRNASYSLLAVLQGKATASEVNQWLKINTTRSTQRALETLHAHNLVLKSGPSNNPKYAPSYQNILLNSIDTKMLEDEKRPSSTYRYALLDYLEMTSKDTLDELLNLPKRDIKDLGKKELEHLTIELSWKSSALEGNTYSLLDTELLLKEGLRAKEKTDFETQMILNHKEAIDFIRENPELFKEEICSQSVIELHKIIGKNIGIKSGVRKRTVHISSSNYQPETDPHKLKESLDRTLGIINNHNNPFIKSLLALALIPYLQHFEDGNKRTGRLMSNAILISYLGYGYSLRNVDAKDLALAYLSFYEINNLEPLYKIFINEINQKGQV